MGISIEESDEGTKEQAKIQFDKVPLLFTEELRARLEEWWAQVIDMAYFLCPKDTGTLAATIRREPIGYEGTGGEMVTGPVGGETADTGTSILEEVLVAGGLLVNPKTGRICDYASWVHDGHYYGSGTGYYEGVPFLTMALDMFMDDLDMILTEASINSERILGEGNMENKDAGDSG